MKISIKYGFTSEECGYSGGSSLVIQTLKKGGGWGSGGQLASKNKLYFSLNYY